jgi:hypothetical protein
MTRDNRWTIATIRAELERVLATDTEWPSYREFVRRGCKALRDAVTRHGGARRWARELGLSYVDRPPGYQPRWTEARVRHELEQFLAGRSAWPRRTEFEALGNKALRDALGRLGGVERWASEFGLPIADRRAGSRRAYTDEEIEHELRPLVERLGRWPTKGEFHEAGLGPLLAALYRYGTIGSWQRKLGVRARPAGPVPDATVWTAERVERELRAFCRGRRDWPRAQEFRARGRWQLYQAASRKGGVDLWKRRLGLSRSR